MKASIGTWARVALHVQTYISRYAVLAAAVLGPLGVLLGTLAADAGGADSPAGRAIGGAAAAIGVALGIAKFVEGAKDWQIAKLLQQQGASVVKSEAVQLRPTLTPGSVYSSPGSLALDAGGFYVNVGSDEGSLDDASAELNETLATASVEVPPDAGNAEAMLRDGITPPPGWTIEGSAELLSEQPLTAARGGGVLLRSAHDRLAARRLAVAAARLGLHHAAALHYSQGVDRWEGIARRLRALHGQWPHHADCSSFVTWCLWTATRAWGLGDFANGLSWHAGYTGTLVHHGVPVTNGHYLLADVALYGDPFGASGHTALLAGELHGVPMVISNGSEAGPFFLPLHYRPDLLVVRRMIR